MAPAIPGQLNRFIGWTLLVAAFASAIWLDSRSVAGSNLPSLPRSSRMAGVVGIALVQLALSQMRVPPLGRLWLRWSVAWLTGLGALTYASGTFLEARWAAAVWLILAGTMMTLAGLILISRTAMKWQIPCELRIILATFCFAMFVLVVVETISASPDLFPSIPIASGSDMRSRMLRLARAAGATLPVLTFLHHGLALRADPDSLAVRWGRVCMLSGTILMATILMAAGMVFPGLRFLLPIPAIAVFVGAATGLRLARRHAGPLELWGWFLIVLSMAGGLLVGMVAFDGPLPPSGFIGEYGNHARQLIRQAHVYAIVFGVVSIFISRELDCRHMAVSPLRGGSTP